MVVTVLFGSPHENGSTRALLDAFLSAFPPDCHTGLFSAYEMLPRPCVDCGGCRENGKRVFDDLDVFFDAVSRSDVLVIASPLYHYSFPAPVKAFIDRTQRFFGLPERERKLPCALLMCGGAPHANAATAERELFHALSAMGAYLSKTVVASGTDRSGVKEDCKKLAAIAAKSIIKELQGGKENEC